MKRKILIRFDDLCPTMDWEQWNKAVSIIDDYQVHPLVGVIPNCQDPDLKIMDARDDFWDYVRELQTKGYTIAMHGYEHVFDSKKKGLVNARHDSEFAGHTYQVQYQKISKGKKILNDNGIETDVFFAPAHSYDDNTMKALFELGFKYLVDGKSKKIIKRNNLYCIPCRDAGVPHIHKKGVYVAIFHAHEWKCSEKYGEFLKFEQLCKHQDVCAFEDLLDEKLGNYYWGLINEKMFIIYDTHFRPTLSKLKKFF